MEVQAASMLSHRCATKGSTKVSSLLISFGGLGLYHCQHKRLISEAHLLKLFFKKYHTHLQILTLRQFVKSRLVNRQFVNRQLVKYVDWSNTSFGQVEKECVVLSSRKY